MSERNNDNDTMAITRSGASGPVRPSKAKQTRQRRAPGNNKPYARPASKSQQQAQTGDGSFSEGLKRSDSQSSLFGGIKSVFGRLFGGASAADAETSSRSNVRSSQRDSTGGDESFDPDRTKSVQGDFSTDGSEDEGDDSRYLPTAEGEMDESFDDGPRTSGSGGQDVTTGDSNKRFLPSPEHASSQPSSKRVRRASPSPEKRPMGFRKNEMSGNGMSGSVSLGYASPSLSSIARGSAAGKPTSGTGTSQLGGMRRSGTLLNLDLHRSVRPNSEITRQTEQSHHSNRQQTLPSSGLRNSKVWSPWNEHDEAAERRQRSSVASSAKGFSRSGSVGYGLNAATASPLRQSYAGMAHTRAGGRMDLASYGAAPSASPFAAPTHPSSPGRPRTLLHPLQSASITRSPSLPGGGGRMRASMASLSAMRDPFQRDRGRDSTALPSSPLVTQTHTTTTAATAQHHRHQEIERSPSMSRIRDSSVLSGMSDLVVRDPLAQINKRSKMHALTPEVFELQHKTEADRILASLTNMRNVNPSSNTGLSASYSSRTLRKQISVPAPSPLQDFDPLSLASSGLGKLRKTRETDTSVMVSPYANKRARGRKLQVEESEESGDEGGQSQQLGNEDRQAERNVSEAPTERRHRSQTPMREIANKQPGSPAPAQPKRADPASFPEPTIKVSKPLPVAFSPSAKNLPSSARATSSLRAKTTMTTRKHTSAAGSATSSARPGRFSAVDDDEDEDDYSPDLAELEAAAAAKASSGSAFSSAPKITGPMDLFAPKVAAPASSTSELSSEGSQPSASTHKDEQQPGSLRQAPSFLNVKADHRPRASSPLKAMVVPSPESNKSSPSSSQPASGSGIPSFSFAKPSTSADTSKPPFSFAPPGSADKAEQSAASSSKSTFNFGLGKPSSNPVPATSSFTFGTPDKSTTSQEASTTPKAPVPSATSFSFNAQNGTSSEAPKMPSFSFGAPTPSDKSASGPPSLFSQAAVEKPALVAPAEPQGVAPPKTGLFSFTTAPPSTAVVDVAPVAKASLPTGNPFASVLPASNSATSNPLSTNAITAGTTKNLFSFGAPVATPATAPTVSSQDRTANAPAGSSLFGSPAPASPAPSVAPAFNFGAPASNATGGSTSAPSFSFGKPAETAKPTASPSFAFGTSNSAASASTAVQAAQKPQPVPSFSFGAPGNTSSNAAPAANVGGFGSGGSATPTTSTGFNFGATAPAFGNSSPAPTGFGAAPATAMFGSSNTTAPPVSVTPAFGGFGNSTATSTPPATNTGFNFAAPTAPSFNAPFAFGAPPAAAAAPAAAASFGGFGTASPAFGAREATATPPPTFNMGADNTPSSPGGGRKIRSMPKRKK
ncbi:hypothetical protein QFC22_003625 [Naganishia vaughanmartiniae]|uniref:Uncharacterized protein n=1 Tax=Naganishia vaughanmartiniae TaxID=1424756 RepID=A0ACC2X6U8_9TREE|nr:hypothetical protein QFC22_003625 [Naganishia vaughanmartiniae]